MKGNIMVHYSLVETKSSAVGKDTLSIKRECGDKIQYVHESLNKIYFNEVFEKVFVKHTDAPRQYFDDAIQNVFGFVDEHVLIENGMYCGQYSHLKYCNNYAHIKEMLVKAAQHYRLPEISEARIAYLYAAEAQNVKGNGSYAHSRKISDAVENQLRADVRSVREIFEGVTIYYRVSRAKDMINSFEEACVERITATGVFAIAGYWRTMAFIPFSEIIGIRKISDILNLPLFCKYTVADYHNMINRL